ncbi:MAG: sel1 repeat family protein [Muribaculaceae bacterium]|nr:sel1 repeat family protein [Muribaculaceae bacterium]
MKKLLFALLFAATFASAFAQDAVEVTVATVADSVAVDSVVDPMARFEGMSMAKAFNEGVRHQRKRDYVQALPCFQYAAEQGYAEAQYLTGAIYYNGSAGKKDDEMAVKYWTMASDQNHGKAQFDLGQYYYRIEDYPNAMKYWELAVENGLPEPMNNIALCYQEGRGVDCDEEMALVWYQRAAEAGDKTATYNIGTFYELGKGGLQPDIEKAIEWYTKAWSLGSDSAKFALDRLQQ